MIPPRNRRGTCYRPHPQAGFTLLELLVAVGIFLVVSTVAFVLFSRHQGLLAKEQAVSGLDLGLRAALAQIQGDVVNGGAGMIMGSNLPNAPIAVSIYNNNGISCQNLATFSYASSCFDKLWVIVPDQSYQLMHPTMAFDTSTAPCSISVAPVAANTPANITMPANTQVMFLKNVTSGTQFTTAVLSSATTFNGANTVTVNYNCTQSGGTNSSASNDPTGMTVGAAGTAEIADVLTSGFLATDWVFALAAVEYYVDTTNPADPQLMRQKGNTQAALVLDQVIGFKVGAAYFGSPDSSIYHYLTSDYGPDFSLIRSIRATLLARTPPGLTFGLTNPFDGGPYQVVGASVVVNPRNVDQF